MPLLLPLAFLLLLELLLEVRLPMRLHDRLLLALLQQQLLGLLCKLILGLLPAALCRREGGIPVQRTLHQVHQGSRRRFCPVPLP